MSLDPFLAASWQIQIHVVLALIALILGPVALWRKRRDRMHKMIGYIWVVSMTLASLVSFAIPSHFSPIGFGPIHLLSIYGLSGIYVAMRAIYRRDIRLHKEVMENLYVRGVALAGAFNFLPGRTTQRALLPDTPELGYVIIAAALIWAFLPMIMAALPKQSYAKRDV
ncbi:MAG: DUF2306 domain-containing protein [Paracoccaceae bacterium]